MNFDDLKQAWSSQVNQATPADLNAAHERLKAQLKSRRRKAMFMTIYSTVMLSLPTFLAVQHLWFRSPDSPPVSWMREWSSVAILGLSWVYLLWTYAGLKRHYQRYRHTDRSPRLCLQALLDDNRRERRGIQILILLCAATAVLIPFAAAQLKVAGKAGSEINFPAYVIAPAILGFVCVALWWRDRRKLLVQKRELEALQASYRSSST